MKYFILTLFIFLFSSSSYAQEAPAIKLDPMVQAQKDSSEKTMGLVKALVEKLKNENDQKHFSVVYNTYNLINTVKIVQKDVSNAINACGKANPEMKTDLDQSFGEWKNQIEPVHKEARTNLDSMVKGQKYAKESEIKKIFKALDDTRQKTDALIEKNPITTQEACEKLLSKMNKTQEELVTLLRSTLVSYPIEKTE